MRNSTAENGGTGHFFLGLPMLDDHLFHPDKDKALYLAPLPSLLVYIVEQVLKILL